METPLGRDVNKCRLAGRYTMKRPILSESLPEWDMNKYWITS